MIEDYTAPIKQAHGPLLRKFFHLVEGEGLKTLMSMPAKSISIS